MVDLNSITLDTKLTEEQILELVPVLVQKVCKLEKEVDRLDKRIETLRKEC